MKQKETDLLGSAVSAFGKSLKEKLSKKVISGAPEDQLRGPLEKLLEAIALISLFKKGDVVAHGETALSDLKIRPDYAVTVKKALVGFIEIKAPGKGADPRKFKDDHDRKQAEKLKSIPNLIYTDGNAFSLWRNGKLEGAVVKLSGDVETAGDKLTAPPALQNLFSSFLQWEPIPPASPRALAEVSAGLCRLLRDEVAEQLALANAGLTELAKGWRQLLFPDATDVEFADGYAQAVTFGLLMARARNISIVTGLDQVAKSLAKTNSVIGAALQVLTDSDEAREALVTSFGTLVRVLEAVDWALIGKGNSDAWLYFYEHFLEVYDNDLRKETGSYYTPPEVVTSMVRLVDDVLRDTKRFDISEGLVSSEVTVADPAVGTGTYLLGVLRHIAKTTEDDQGPGAVAGVIKDALKRIIGFELQFGPFAVAQLRILAEVADLLQVSKIPTDVRLRLYITDTLSNPDEVTGYLPSILKALGVSRSEANAIKRAEPITVVIGNPPYKERAGGEGGWIEAGDNGKGSEPAPLARWFPPKDWKIGVHSKHLYNFYIYFWRWATWKVFGDPTTASKEEPKKGIVCFITVAGFLQGPGFEAMRADLRHTADEIWVIDCSPEGHQPAVSTRIFQGVQHPVCILMVARTGKTPATASAKVKYQSLPLGSREGKFKALAKITLDGNGWESCSSDWRATFLPAAKGGWATYPTLESLFGYNSSGLKAGRTWPIAPDRDSLEKRWARLLAEKDPEEKEKLFHPQLRHGVLAARHINKVVREHLGSIQTPALSIAKSTGKPNKTVRFGFRSFDRQWLIADARLINDPRPELWYKHSSEQVYMTALLLVSPTSGPAVTFTAEIPDQHHYKGSFGGRVFPLWADAAATETNVHPAVLDLMQKAYGKAILGEDVYAYIAAVTAHRGYAEHFATDLKQPGLRVPITADLAVFEKAAAVGREVIWLHTFGDRYISKEPSDGRPAGAPRLAKGDAPQVPAKGAISSLEDDMPQELRYEAVAERLWIGTGYIDNVSPAVWAYEVSGKPVIAHWFSYRCLDRSRPIIGERREPSPLGDIQPPGWLAEYTTELLNVINILGRLLLLEPQQQAILIEICDGPIIAADELGEAVKSMPAAKKKKLLVTRNPKQGELL